MPKDSKELSFDTSMLNRKRVKIADDLARYRGVYWFFFCIVIAQGCRHDDWLTPEFFAMPCNDHARLTRAGLTPVSRCIASQYHSTFTGLHEEVYMRGESDLVDV